MADYNEYSIVAEEQCVCVQRPPLPRAPFNELLDNRECRDTVLRICTQQTSWEFTLKNNFWWDDRLNVKNIHKDHTPMVAEIVMWEWNDDNKQKVIKDRHLITSSFDNYVHFIIRLLGKRKLVDDLCPPLDFLPFDDAFTISVGDQNFVVSAHRLMQISPVFHAMLTDEMREKAERKVEVKDAEPEHFRAFLEVIDPEQNVHPNPKNVCGILKLADRYQVNMAKDRCEAHLVSGVEIPLIKRLQLADTYGLNKLKDSILSIGSVKLRALYNANLYELQNEGIFSKKLRDEMTKKLNDNE